MKKKVLVNWIRSETLKITQVEVSIFLIIVLQLGRFPIGTANNKTLSFKY
ncbi:hypothetical protein WKT22_00246 [Candidatus Lokiarchaeum ossiferum]